MIYHLFEALKDLNFPGHGLLSYLSVRAILAASSSLILSLVLGKRIISWLQKKKFGETIRDLGLEGQMNKEGTPTMGGIIILLSLLGGVLLFCDLSNIYTQLLLLTTVWLGGLGFADDYIKVFKHNKDGLSEKMKLLGQVVLGFIIAFAICASNEVDTTRLTTTLPFFKNHEFDYSWLSPFNGQLGVYCTWAVYVVMIVFVTTACSNSVNLTDGLDGLATGTSAIVFVVIGIFAWLSGNSINAEYLNIMYIPGTGEIAVFMAALVGALIGFLWYNSYPAQVFMGDTGSLALGGIIGVGAILIKKELMLPILCGIFFVEALSVILQRFYFRRTRKKQGEGVRIFRMTPIHHHFQKENIPALIQRPKRAMPENKIVVRFWIIGILLAAATFALLKVR